MSSPRAAATIAALLWLAAGSAAAATPDLTVTAVSGATQSAGGKSISVTTSVAAASGAAVSTSFRVGIYLSTDAQITTADTLLGSRTVSKLSAGATSTASTSVTVPAGLAGSYYLGAIVDDLGQVSESDETNNARAGSAIQLLRPDLTISAIGAATQAGAGATVSVSTTALNASSGPDVGAFRVGIYLSTTSTLTGSATLLGFRNVSSLKAGAQSKGSTSVQLPVGISGTYYLVASVDDTGQVAEASETNNTASAAITVVAPDLTITSSAPTSAGAGASINVSTAVTSRNAAAGPFKVGIYLSSDATLTAADTLLGQLDVARLAAGSTLSSSTAVTLPLGLSGTYYVGAIADPDNAIAESNEGNNASTATKITLVAPDLTVTAVSGPATGSAGASIDVNTSVAAATTGGRAGPFRVDIYLSSDATITPGDTLVGGRDVSGLAAGATSQAVTTVTVPATLPSGTYYVGAIADGAGTVPESSETNNARAGGTIQVVGDVTPPVITVTGVADGDVRRDAPLGFCYSATDASAVTATADLDGVAQGSCGSTLLEGDHVLTVRAVDAYGNVAQSVIQFALDFTAPVLLLSGVVDGQVTAAASVTPVHGAADLHLAASTATLNGSPWAGGAISQEGDYVLELEAADRAGNASSATVRFSLDRTAPVIQVSGITEDGLYRQAVTPGFALVEAHPATSGMQLDGQPLAAGTAVDGEGAHTLVISATDAAGNASSRSVHFRIDRTQPTLAIVAPGEGAAVALPSIEVVASASDAGGLQAVTAQGVALTLGGDGNYHGLVPLAEGANALAVLATDRAGNASTATVHVTRDTAAPILTVTGVAEGAIYRQPVTPGFDLVEAHPGTAGMQLDGQELAAGTPVGSDGAHTLVVSATDAAGNGATVTVHFTVDRTPPTLSLVGPPEGTTVSAESVEVVATATDTVGLQGVTAQGTALSLAADGNYHGVVALTEGPNALLVVATDVGGNEATATVQVTRDTTPPQLVITTPADGATVVGPGVQVAGTVIDGAGLTVDDQPVVLGPDGGFQTTLTLSVGEHTFTFVAVDAAGNSDTATRKVTVQAPTMTVAVTEPVEGFLTSAATVTVRGTVTGGVPPATVDVNGAQGAVAADGSFAVTVDVPVGAVTLAIQVTDAAGHGAQASRTGTRANPGGGGKGLTVILDAPADGAVLRGRVVVSGRIDGGQPPYQAAVLGVPATVSSMYFTAVVNLTEGDQLVSVTAGDAAGHGGAAQRAIVVDDTPPYVAITRPATTPSAAHESPYLVEGDVGDLHLAGVTVNGQPASVLAGRFSASVPLQAGPNDVVVTATDLAGNRTSRTAHLDVSSVPPAVTILAPDDGTEATAPTVLVRAHVSGTAGISGVNIGTAPATLVDGEWRATVPLALGSNAIVVTAADAAGLTATATVHVTYKNPSSEPLAVTGIDPAPDSTGIESDALVSVSFNKAIAPSSLGDHFTVRANGAALVGSFYVAPGNQTVSFIAKAPLPAAQRLEVRVDGVGPAAGPGMAGRYTSAFTTRPLRTVFRGVVMDSVYQPVSNARVTIEGSGASTQTEGDGNWAFVDAQGGTAFVRFDGGVTADGARLPTVRRRIFVNGDRDTVDHPFFLTPVDAASAQRVDGAGPVHLDFGQRYPGLAIDVEAQGLFFESGQTAGTVTATQLTPMFLPVDVENGNALTGVWQVQPVGIRLAKPVQVKLPNLSSLPPGRLAILVTYDPALCMLKRTAVGKVSADGSVIESTGPVTADGLDFIGYMGLNADQDAALRQALGGGSTSGAAPPTTGKNERARPSVRRVLEALSWLAGGTARADISDAFIGPSSPPLFSVDRLFGSRACGVHGRVRTGYDSSGVAITARAPTLIKQLRVTLPYYLPVDFDAVPQDEAGRSLVSAELAASRDVVLAPPNGQIWASPSVYGTASVQGQVPLELGTTTTVTITGRSDTESRTAVYEAKLEPLAAGSGAAATEALLTVTKKFDNSDSARPPATYFSGWTVSASAGSSEGSDVSRGDGAFNIPVCAIGTYDAYVCASVDTGTRFQISRDTSFDGTPRVSYTPISKNLQLCSTAYNYVTIPTFHRSDIIVDLRVLAGKLVFKNRDGSVVGGRCDEGAVTERRADGGLSAISPEDLATTEVHFFREDQHFKDPIARFTVAIPGTKDEATCDPSAHARYQRVRAGPSSSLMKAQARQCASLYYDLSTSGQRLYNELCKSLERTNFTRLQAGDRLVVVAVNHATGWTGMTTLNVPEVAEQPAVAPGETCAADDANGGPIVVQDDWSGSTQPFTVSRCATNNIFVDAPIDLYPPELDVRVARRRRDDGVQDATTRVEHLVRNGGAATTTDSVIQVSTNWRVRIGVPPANAPEAAAGSAGPQVGDQPQVKADPTLPKPTDPAEPPNGTPGEPLEVLCSELPPNAPQAARDRCVDVDKYLAEVPAGVPPLAGHVVRVTGTAVEQPAVSVFRVPPGRSTANVQTALRLVQPGKGAVTLPNLTVANYYVHVVGHSLLFNDLNQNGLIDPGELERRDPPPPELQNFADDGPAGLPVKSVALKDVYLSQEADGSMLQRFDRSREHEFQVVSLEKTSATAIQSDGTTRDLDDPDVKPPNAATEQDVSYQFLLQLVKPEPGRAGTMSGDLVAWLGSDQYGVRCDLKMPETGSTAMSADCGGDYIYDILAARDVIYFELFYSGNAENVLYRYNFYGLTRRTDYLTAGRHDTAKDAVTKDQEDGTPAMHRPISRPVGVEIFLQPSDLRSGRITVSTDPQFQDVLAEIKTARLKLKEDGSYEISEPYPDQDKLPLAQLKVAEGLQRLHLPIPNDLAQMKGADNEAKDVFLRVEPDPDPWYPEQPEYKWALGKPRGTFTGAFARPAAHSNFHGVDVADGHVAFRHEDFSLPEFTSAVQFGRIYDNQDNEVGPVGTGWRHDFEGFVQEERLGRYVVVLAGQAYNFPKCQQVDEDKETAQGCLTDDSHGGRLTVDRTPEDFPDVVFEAANGWRYRFDRLSVAAGPFLPPHQNGGDPDALPGRRRWVLTAIDDGHARDPKNVKAAGWVVVTYRPGSDMVAGVVRNQGKLGITFTYEPVPDEADKRLKALASRFGFQFLRTITAGPVTVTLVQDPKTGNLLSATRSTGDSYDYQYLQVPPGLESEDAWAAVNELEKVTYRINNRIQATSVYGRSQNVEAFPHERKIEIVDSVVVPGYDSAPFHFGGFDTEYDRTITRPDGVTSNLKLNLWGAVVDVALPLSTSHYSFENDDDQSKRAMLLSQQLPDGRKVRMEPDTSAPEGSRLRTKGAVLESGGNGTKPVTGLGSSGSLVSSTLDDRFGEPTQTTVPGSGGAASISSPLSSSGDSQGVTITDSDGKVTLQLGRQLDDNGVVTFETDGVGRTTTYSAPDASGLPTVAEITGAGGGGRSSLRRVTTRDAFGRVISVSDDLGRIETWGYDPLGRLLNHATPVRADSWSYIEEDNGLTVTENLGGQVTVKRYSDGRLRSEDITYDAGRLATKTYTWVLGRLTKVVLQPSAPVPGERILTWTYGFDEAGRVTSVTVSDGTGSLTSSAELDGAGKPIQTTDYEGLVTDIGYDVLGRAVRWDYGTDGVREVELDANGAVTKTTFGTHELLSPTDALGRPMGTQAKGIDSTVERDGAGRVTKRGDHVMGVTETFAYDVTDRVVRYERLLDSGGSLTDEHSYADGAGQSVDTVTRTIVTVGQGEPRIETRVITLDAAGRARSVQEVVGGQTIISGYVYDAAGRLTTVTGPKPWSRSFDGRGAVVQETDAAGKTVKYVVDAMGLPLAENGPSAERAWTFTYDAIGRMTSKKLGELVWKYAYGVTGPGSMQETDPMAYVTTQRHDAAQRLRQVARSTLVKEYEYDGEWPSKETTREGSWSLQISSTFDDRGRQLSRGELWSGGGQSYSYSSLTSWNQRAATLTEDWSSDGRSEGRTGSFEVDSLGNLVTRSMGVTDRWSYDSAGLLVREALAGRPERTWTYSGLVPMTETYGSSEVTEWTYDASGRMQTEKEPSGRTRTMTWDPRGMIASSNYGGDLWSYTYDDNGYLLTATHAGLSTWTYDHGPMGELRSVTQPNALGTFTYPRDPLGRLKQIVVTPADGIPDRKFDYDALDRQTLRTRGTSSWTTTWADGIGTTTLPNGDQQTQVLDGRGRIARKTFSPGPESVAGLSSVSYAYNGLDDLMQVSESGVEAGTTTFEHDGRGLLRFVRRSGAPEVEYGRRASGEVSFRRVGQTTVAYDYDALERVNRVYGPAGILDIEVEAGGERIASISGPNAHERRCYDGAGRVARVIHATMPASCDGLNTGVIDDYAYAYSPGGNRLNEIRWAPGGTETTTYGYDAADRLTGVQYGDHAAVYKLAVDGTRLGEKTAAFASELGQGGFEALTDPATELAYHYDARGGLTSVTDELASDPSARTLATYAVDSVGRVRGRTTYEPEEWVDGDGTPHRGTRRRDSTFAWDGEGRLRSGHVAVTDHTGVATTSVAYSYDGLGQRVSARGPDHAKSWVWGEGEVVAETYSGSPTLAYQHVGSEPVAVGGEQLLRDGMGSVVGRIGRGAPVEYRYDAWGGFRTSSQPSVTGPTLAYAGQHWDAELGLSYAQQRWYEPGVGRFLSEDPVPGDPSDPNALSSFGYANGNPLAYWDPYGLFSWKGFMKGVGAAVVGIAIGIVVGAVIVATGGVAIGVIAVALGASTATAAAVGTAIAAGALAAYGGFSVGEKLYEWGSGRKYAYAGNGRTLTDEERSAAAGESLVGVAAIFLPLAKGRGVGKARLEVAPEPERIDVGETVVQETAPAAVGGPRAVEPAAAGPLGEAPLLDENGQVELFARERVLAPERGAPEPLEAPDGASAGESAQFELPLPEVVNSPKQGVVAKFLTRLQAMGKTPGKSSRTGRGVVERMIREGTFVEDPVRGKIFRASDGKWYPLRNADMAHRTDAVTWWNAVGKYLGAKSPAVRRWMLDPNNYVLDHFHFNRSLGAKLGLTGARYQAGAGP